MRNFSAGIFVVSGCAAAFACGSDDDGESTATPVAACKQANSVACGKIFSCFSQAELDAATTVVGLNSSDCRTKFDAGCEMRSCNAGQTYRSDKAQDCINGFKQFSCEDIRGLYVTRTTLTPAACDQICVRQ